MKTRLILFIGIMCLLACQSDIDPQKLEGENPPASIPRQDIELTSIEKQLSIQTNMFAFNLLKTVYGDENEKHKNIFLSPLSAALALSMLNNGAIETTQNEIQKTIGYGEVSRDVVNIYAQKIVNAMQTLDPRGKFESANSIWIQTGFSVLNAFKQVNQQYYNADIQNVDFKKTATLPIINGWVSEKTHGNIPVILKQLPDELTRLILINALYFKGYWKSPFDKQSTFNSDFRTSASSKQTVPTMRQTLLTSDYAKFENGAAMALPFGNGAFSLVAVLPDEDTNISSFINQMDGYWWTDVISKFEKQSYKVTLEIPRFKLEYERTLTDDLIALGMQTPFDEKNANFSLISDSPLFLSTVKQKTFATMNEDGMEAAAVTVEMLSGTSNIEPVSVDFKVNRPFLYFIKEQSTGLVFFAGIMNQITN